MNSSGSERFWKLYSQLPETIREQARDAYRQFANDPAHPSLQFKKVSSRRPLYSARINVNYRVLGILDGDSIIWFWIGQHDEYERLLGRL